MAEHTKENIVEYYSQCEKHYRKFWDLDYSLAMHAGYWDQSTRTLRDALEKENEVLAEMVNIKDSDRVLDAGCGVGGSAIYLSNRFKCEVTGISLSLEQVQRARMYAQQRVDSIVMPTFEVRNFTQTGYPKRSFDVVWAVESVCHAAEKKNFLLEAYRLLKPNGRLVIADGFCCKKNYSPQDQKLMRTWIEGWGVDELAEMDTFYDEMGEVGFEEIVKKDITPHVLPSSRKLYWISIPTLPISRMGEKLGFVSPKLTANLLSARCQWKAIKRGLWSYLIFTAKRLR